MILTTCFASAGPSLSSSSKPELRDSKLSAFSSSLGHISAPPERCCGTSASMFWSNRSLSICIWAGNAVASFAFSICSSAAIQKASRSAATCLKERHGVSKRFAFAARWSFLTLQAGRASRVVRGGFSWPVVAGLSPLVQPGFGLLAGGLLTFDSSPLAALGGLPHFFGGGGPGGKSTGCCS